MKNLLSKVMLNCDSIPNLLVLIIRLSNPTLSTRISRNGDEKKQVRGPWGTNTVEILEGRGTWFELTRGSPSTFPPGGGLLALVLGRF